MKAKLLTRISTPRMVAFSFILLILVGSVLLTTPMASATGEHTGFLTALFTATSATCVTGLVVVNTAAYWSLFGKCIILILIQIGGLGLMTVIATAFILARKKIGISERKILKESAGNMELQGVVSLIIRIIKGTIIFEVCGAALLAIRFIPVYGVGRGIWYGVFHSVSAFCNAGFDIIGDSLMSYASDPFVLSVIMLLIIIGGIGFLVWNDMAKKKLHIGQYNLHTKIVLVMTFILIAVGTVGYLVLEQRTSMLGEGGWNRFWSALFMSVTSRTAGFNSIDLSQMSEPGNLITMFLMFIGGSPASTAGGIKTTTFAIIILAVASLTRGEDRVVIFNKTLKRGILSQATVVFTIYMALVVAGTMVISYCDQIPVVQAGFEAVSAVATVGLTVGITTTLSPISQVVLILLMYAGRIGGFTLVLALREKCKQAIIKRPEEKVLIG